MKKIILIFLISALIFISLLIIFDHKIEESSMLANKGDLTLFNKLIEILRNPYKVNKDDLEFMSPSLHNDKKYQTFCGT